jgi:translation elongation factor EF-Ts
MIDLKCDPSSSTSLRGAVAEQVRLWEASGEPVMLRLNGETEFVLKDRASRDLLVQLAEELEEREITRRSVQEMKAGLGRPAEEMLAEMRAVVAEQTRP